MLCSNFANLLKSGIGDIGAVKYQNKPFLKESFYTLKNNIDIGEKMAIYNGFRFEALCPNCGNWTDDVDNKQEYACCFNCGLMKLDNIFQVREGRYVKVI